MTKKRIAFSCLATIAVLTLGVTAYSYRYLFEEYRWLSRLESGTRPEQEAAAQELAKLGSIRSVPRLLDFESADRTALDPNANSVPLSRRASSDSVWFSALLRIGDPALPVLIEEFRHSEEVRRKVAKEVILKIEVSENESDVLLQILRDDELKDLREYATYRLVLLGKKAARLRKPLLKLAKSDDAERRLHALTALRYILDRESLDYSEYRADLISSLDHSNVRVQSEAAYSIGQFKESSPKIIARLRAIANGSPSRAARTAEWALDQLGASGESP
ncbi:MAG: HEAT repeat domain-containing protein [Planctomycetota bacterium]